MDMKVSNDGMTPDEFREFAKRKSKYFDLRGCETEECIKRRMLNFIPKPKPKPPYLRSILSDTNSLPPYSPLPPTLYKQTDKHEQT